MTSTGDRVVVLGASSNVGGLLLKALATQGRQVAGSVRSGSRPPAELPRDAVLNVDLLEPSTLEEALLTGDTILWTPWVTLAPENLDALVAAKPKRVVFISSASVHTTLESAGAEEKREAEAAIRDSGVPYTIIRPTMIYGNARDRNLTRLLGYLGKFPVFPLFGSGSGLMQPVHIDDLVDAILAAEASPTAEGKTYDLGGAAPLRYRDLVRLTARARGRRAILIPIPLAPAALAARLANRLGVHIVREEQVRRVAEDKDVDIAPIVTDLGVRPRSFAEGIASHPARRKARTAARS